jgi:hypothetical protein
VPNASRYVTDMLAYSVNIGTGKRRYVGRSGQFGIILFLGIGCADAADWRAAKYECCSSMNVCMCLDRNQIAWLSLRKMHGSTFNTASIRAINKNTQAFVAVQLRSPFL